MKINYNEECGCYELLRWDCGWQESGLSFETEADAIDYCNENSIEIEN